MTEFPLPCSALMSQSRNHLRLTSEGCEATGKQDATLWWLTSPATPAILRGVGCTVGGPTLLGGSGAGRTTPDYPTMFMALLMALS